MVKPIALTGVEQKTNMSIEMLYSDFTWNTSDAIIYIDSLLLRNIALDSSYSSRNWWVKQLVYPTKLAWVEMMLAEIIKTTKYVVI